MDFFISSAYAQAAGGAAQPNLFMNMLPLLGLFVVFYFMLIRPQMKRAKEQRAMIGALAKGDEVVTNGGFLGRIVELSDSYVSVEIAANTVVKLQKAAIAAVLPKGTLKSA
jgi:preprotein translocase subunit YajC